MSIPALSDTPAAAPLVFTGRNAVFRRLVVRGAMLEFVTFGFYRFWLTTDIRRHLWSNTEIAGDALEYTGRGKELLFGFLIATAVLGPVFLIYFIAGLKSEEVQPFAGGPLYLLLIAFGQFAAYRARRYRLTRTVWRGVRFWMTGSGWSYAWRSMLWALLLGPTLGFAYPWRTAALERFKLRHTLYGNLPGRFEATGAELFQRVWWVWLLGILPFVLIAAGAIALVVAMGLLIHPGHTTTPPTAVAILAGTAIAVGVLAMVALPFLHAIRRAREWAWWIGGLRFGTVAVTSSLRSDGLIGIYWALIGWWVLIVSVYGTVAGTIGVILAKIAGIASTGIKGDLPIWVIGVYVPSYLILVLIFWVLMRIYTLQRVWRRVVETTSVVNIAGAADVTAAGDLVSAFGEGLADGLDFGL